MDDTEEKANNSNPALFEKALEICEKAHAGQFRRDGITPYAVHPKAVAKILSNKDEHIRAVALLHDVLEDTDMTAKDLLDQRIPERIVEAVKLLSKQPEDTYDTFIDRLLESKDYMARTVKIADIIANLQDSPTEKQVKKYSKALERLVLDELYTQRI